MTSRVLRAQIAFRCCGTAIPEWTTGPCWQLFVVMTGRVSDWPTFTWPTSPQVPTVKERADALAALGFTLAESTEWDWCEDTTSGFHLHSERVALMAAAEVRPLDGGAA